MTSVGYLFKKLDMINLLILTQNVTSLKALSFWPILDIEGPTGSISNSVAGCISVLAMKQHAQQQHCDNSCNASSLAHDLVLQISSTGN